MFAVSEQNVKDIEVRVHFVTISGKVSVLGYEKDPRVYILEG